jgi:hypothetical protein
MIGARRYLAAYLVRLHMPEEPWHGGLLRAVRAGGEYTLSTEHARPSPRLCVALLCAMAKVMGCEVQERTW